MLSVIEFFPSKIRVCYNYLLCFISDYIQIYNKLYYVHSKTFLDLL